MRASALLVIVAVVGGVSGCAASPAADPTSPAPAVSTSPTPAVGELTGRASIEGMIVQLAASADGRRSYALQVGDLGFLPLALPDRFDTMGGRGVIVAVPADLKLPADHAGVFAALSAYSTQTDMPLQVISLLQ